MKFIYYNIEIIHSDLIMDRFSSLFHEFRNSSSRVSYGYYVIFMIRRIILAIGFHLIKMNSIIQLCAISLPCWSVVVYLLIYRPFVNKSTNMVQIVVEICVSVVYTIPGLLLKKEIDPEVIGWIIFSFINISYIIQLVPIILNAVRKLIRLIKSRRNKSNGNNLGGDKHTTTIAASVLPISQHDEQEARVATFRDHKV